MRRWLTLAAALGATASGVSAGGVDRTGQSMGLLFEEGNFALFSFGSAAPSVSGAQTVQLGPFPPGSPSGDMTEAYTQFSIAYKHDFGNGLEAAIIFDQPFGADVNYPADQLYFARASIAELETRALTGVLHYTFPSNFSVHGGLRYQELAARAVIPFVTLPPESGSPFAGVPYQANGEEDSALGYLVGVGYEIPEIALRVSLTYNSAIEHKLPTSEGSSLGASISTTEIDTPQSVNLEFETGVAEDTLLFGSVRWVEWTEFEIAPADYVRLVGSPLVSYESDRTTYTLGLGRRFTESFAGAVSVSFEPQDDKLTSNLGPTDGFVGVALGGTYTVGNVELTGGVRYVRIGDAKTRVNGIAATQFDDNHAFGVGLQVGYRF